MANMWLDLFDFDEVRQTLAEYIIKSLKGKSVLNARSHVSTLMAEYFKKHPKHARFEARVGVEIILVDSPGGGHLITDIKISLMY